MPKSAIFQSNRDKLFGIAYRITGSVVEAEDIVQETFIRWDNAEVKEIKSPEAWLSTVTTRMSLDVVKSARVQRQSYIGPWLPEPLIESAQEPDKKHEIDQTVTMALMVLLDQLSAAERASYILHDLFNYKFQDIADMLKRSEASCRKLASRGREKVRFNPSQSMTTSEKHQSLIEAFFKATRDADDITLKQILREDVVFHSDGGGKAAAATHVLTGIDEVIPWFAKVLTPAFSYWQRKKDQRTIEWFNGSPGLVLWQGNKAISAFSLTIDNNVIRQIHVLRNPDKLKLFVRQK